MARVPPLAGRGSVGAPADLAGPRVEGGDHAGRLADLFDRAAEVVLTGRVFFQLGPGVDLVAHAEVVGGDVERAGRGAVGGRPVLDPAEDPGADDGALAGRAEVGARVAADVGRAGDRLAGGGVERRPEAGLAARPDRGSGGRGLAAAGPGDRADRHLHHRRRLHGVVVPGVVADLGVRPFDLAGLRVERDGGVGERVAAGTPRVGVAGGRVAGRDVGGAAARVDHRWHPDVAAAVRAAAAVPALARRRDHEGAPELLAGLRLVGGDEAAQAAVARRAADDQLAVEERPGRVHRVAFFRVDDLGLPARFAGLRVEGDQLVVGGGQVDAPGAVGDAAADRLVGGEAGAGDEIDRRRVGPPDLAGGGVDREDPIGPGVVEHRPTDHDREGLPGELVGPLGPRPGDLQPADVAAVDLVEVGVVGVLGDVAPMRPVDVTARRAGFGTPGSPTPGKEEYGQPKGKEGSQSPRENR